MKASVSVSGSYMNTQQPQLLKQLKEKSTSLRIQQEKMKEQAKAKSKSLKSVQQQIQKLYREKQIQERKYKSLVVLVAQLQRQYDQTYIQTRQVSDQDQTELINQSNTLRTFLIKQAERVNDYKSLAQFLKQLQSSKNKASDYLNKSRYLENQVELLAKLRTKLTDYTNSNLECRRKWADLERENKKLDNELRSLKIQLQRQKTEMKEQYQQYLQQVNQSKTKLVYFNETNNSKPITEHFVKEMALLQENRVEIEQQHKNLQYHRQNLQQELGRIAIQNKELQSFFQKSGEQSKLANKMRTRIQELKDSLLQQKKKNSSLRVMKLTKTLQHVKGQHQKVKQSNDYLQIRIRQQKNGTYNLDEKDIVGFFTKVMNSKDEEISVLREQESALIEKLRQLRIKKSLIQNQIQTLEEGMDVHNTGQNYKDASLHQELLHSNQFTFKKDQDALFKIPRQYY